MREDIKMDLKYEVGWEVVYWNFLVQDRDPWLGF
jgi:hypothetical protein